tara:strand:- start:5507 stop:6079 length:573 start_codon:yes stop_codon:yes gene_type:complete
MGLGNVFVRSVVREIGRNYGKSISNNLLGDSHSTPVRVVGSYLGQGTGGRNYKHQLEKICKTWTIKGATATFNVAQNMYKCFFDLVEEAQSDGNVDVGEVMELMKAFVEMRPQLKKVEVALEQLDRDDLAKKVDEFDDSIFEFFVELNEGFTLPPKPTGWFKSKKKKAWEINNSIKNHLQKWTDDYNAQK